MPSPRFVPVMVAVSVAGFTSCAPRAGGTGSRRGDRAMIQSTPRSIVLRSSHVVRVKVVAAKPGAWAPSKPGLKTRKVELSLQIEEAFRGKVEPPPDGPVSLTVAQTGYAGELMMQPLPGSWSSVPIDAGTELVAFSESSSPRAEGVLEEPACKLVAPADAVLPGLRIAAQALARDLSLRQTIDLAAPVAAKLDPIFAEFVWEHYADEAMASQRAFGSLAEFSERKELTPGTRQALIDAAYRLVSLRGDETPERGQRLALTMCRTLLMPEAADLHENLIGTYLPNLVGLASGLPPQPASRVFAEHQSERKALEAFLRRHGTDADAEPLLAWLHAK